MIHKFNEDFFKIADQILAENKSLNEWVEIESSDLFQEGSYVGGFDATEMEFCFSVYLDGGEYWFQLPLSDFFKIRDGVLQEIAIRPAG